MTHDKQCTTATTRHQQWLPWAFVAAIVVLGAMGWRRTSHAGGITPAGARRPMPPLALDQLGGGQWTMASHRGQVVLVNYWATWCGPCREEMPGLSKLARQLAPQGLAVVGISLDQAPRAKVQAFVSAMQVPYPIAFPAPLSQTEWGMTGIPATILIDRHGRVAKTYVGAVREADLRADAEALLAER